MARGDLASAIPIEETMDLVRNLLRIRQPIICAVNGHAIGVAATIALFCDIVIMSEEAKIGDPHVNMGLVAGDGGCIIWPLLIGVNRAKQMLMTGEMIKGKDAERIGLVNECLPQDKIMKRALELAHTFANGPVKAIQWTKAIINKRIMEHVASILPSSAAFEYLSMNTRDHKEAASAFLDKRKPSFKGV